MEVVVGGDDEVVLLAAALLEPEEDVLPGALDVEVADDDEEAELEVDVVLTTELLELETMTGLRLLYIDSLLAPPHYLISLE